MTDRVVPEADSDERQLPSASTTHCQCSNSRGRLPDVRCHIEVISRDIAWGPDQQMDWNEFRFLESSANVRTLLSRTRGRRPSATVARDIAACLQQGRQFVESASDAPLGIRPLLLYYGVSSLAKAVVLASRSAAIDTLSQSHGLRDVSAANAMIADLSVRVNSAGLFQEFTEVIAPIQRATYFVDSNLQFVSTPTQAAAQLSGRSVGLLDVLARTSGVAKLYKQTTEHRSKTIRLSLDSFDADTQSIRLNIEDSETYHDRDTLLGLIERLRRDCPALSQWRVVRAELSWGKSYVGFANYAVPEHNEIPVDAVTNDVLTFTADLPNGVAQRFQELLPPLSGGVAEGYPLFVMPLENVSLSEESWHFIGCFLLGSLVRYRPQIWQHAISRSARSDRPSDDHALAMIEQFLGIVARDFPEFVFHAIHLRRPE
jgi:hypothetical protein